MLVYQRVLCDIEVMSAHLGNAFISGQWFNISIMRCLRRSHDPIGAHQGCM